MVVDEFSEHLVGVDEFVECFERVTFELFLLVLATLDYFTLYVFKDLVALPQ